MRRLDGGQTKGASCSCQASAGHVPLPPMRGRALLLVMLWQVASCAAFLQISAAASQGRSVLDLPKDRETRA
jgi:hypothetical protein